jgi:hypothetical protein
MSYFRWAYLAGLCGANQSNARRRQHSTEKNKIHVSSGNRTYYIGVPAIMIHSLVRETTAIG